MRILGIDQGHSSIKAIEIDSAFGRFDIHDYHERVIQPGESAQSALKELIESLPKAPERIIVSMPCSQSTFRNLQLPTRDKKAIQAAVGYELEDELPFSTEDSTYEYSILNQSKQGSFVHVAASLKTTVQNNLGSWKSDGVDPDVLTTETWAYRILLNRILPLESQESPVLLVQIGHERTLIYLQWKGSPVLIREVAWGGKDLTLAISQKFNLSEDQAEAIKLDQGYIGSPESEIEPSPQQSEYSICLEDELEALFPDLRKVELSCKNVTKHRIGAIYLSGGSALLPGLAGWFYERLMIPTQLLLPLSAMTTPSGVTYSEQTEAKFSLAAGLAMGLVGSDRAVCINFRKGELAKVVQSRKLNLEAIKKPLIGVGIVSFCLFLSLVVQSQVYQSRLTTTNTQLEKSIRAFFGQLSSSSLRTYMSNTNNLKTSVKKELNKQRELNKLLGANPHSPLDFLNSLSLTIPKDVVVDMTQFQVGTPPGESFVSGDQTNSGSFTFIISNPQTAEKLATLLSGRISHIQRGQTEEVTSEDASKKWKVSFSGTPTEDSYGK